MLTAERSLSVFLLQAPHQGNVLLLSSLLLHACMHKHSLDESESRLPEVKVSTKECCKRQGLYESCDKVCQVALSNSAD